MSDGGGLLGKNVGSVLNLPNNYWDKQSSGQSNSAGGIGKTTAEMLQKSTYNGWDFVNTWGINEGKSYPFLVHV
ncbi:MAG TPA: hypothetical protein VHE99_01510 [Gammaproteobacteria bacterium]|nr:hypothetical protein [Gammaproteobacteria bacterium]